MSVRPVFLFSLPRSGSTLLQRMLATHPEVATTSEPWILLPQLYALRERGAVAEYGHRTAVRAIADFSDSLPGGRDDYLAEVRRSVTALYEQAAGEAAWFLDKTPRYHLVVDEIMALFPDARFVFLWRNPLAVAASMIESFGRGHWNLDRYDVDLQRRPRPADRRARAGRPADASRSGSRTSSPTRSRATRTVFELLDLDPAMASAESFAGTSLNGRMGDRTGHGELPRDQRRAGGSMAAPRWATPCASAGARSTCGRWGRSGWGRWATTSTSCAARRRGTAGRGPAGVRLGRRPQDLREYRRGAHR